MNKENRAFFGFHPIPAFIYLLSLAAVTMFVANPIVIFIALLGGILFCAILHGRKEFISDLAFYIPIFVILSLVNPLFSHNGVTPLFFMNGNPVTLEAILFGVDMAAMMVAVMLWFKCFSSVMSSDKVLYLFGKIVPKMSLVLSMSLRFIPFFKRKWRDIRRTQIAMGYYSEKGIVSKIQSSARVFSALVTWALENSADMGASMKARGYGMRGRTYFSIFKFTVRDVLLLITGCALALIALFGSVFGYFEFVFYPRVDRLDFSMINIILYISFGIFSFIPFIIEVEEALRWKYLISKI